MLVKASTKALQIAPLQAVGKPAWATLLRAYVDFYGASTPGTQYLSTFDRLIDPARDLHCLVVRTSDGSGEERKLFGIAHACPHQTRLGARSRSFISAVSLCANADFNKCNLIEGSRMWKTYT